ncbi:MAG: hypothetical protein KME01_15805 [Chroococcus sp. CMT-3BRIN-NPC107]|jgi:hypothetical protein|nr:hypothetical protein [Chroococcus sp. CMT-3BRIN-NPC107]
MNLALQINTGSMARQSATERAWSAISRFYENCKKKVAGLKSYPQFQKNLLQPLGISRFSPNNWGACADAIWQSKNLLLGNKTGKQ